MYPNHAVDGHRFWRLSRKNIFASLLLKIQISNCLSYKPLLALRLLGVLYAVFFDNMPLVPGKIATTTNNTSNAELNFWLSINNSPFAFALVALHPKAPRESARPSLGLRRHVLFARFAAVYRLITNYSLKECYGMGYNFNLEMFVESSSINLWSCEGTV